MDIRQCKNLPNFLPLQSQVFSENLLQHKMNKFQQRKDLTSHLKVSGTVFMIMSEESFWSAQVKYSQKSPFAVIDHGYSTV